MAKRSWIVQTSFSTHKMSEKSVDTMGQGGHSPLAAALRKLAMVCAGLGGLAMFSVSLLVTGSVLFRSLGLGGLRGDFELVELACALCASLFLPLCQLNRGHVMVDLFTSWMGPRAQGKLDGLWMLVFAVAWAFISWRLFHGLLEMHDYGDKTMLLRAPIWIVFIPAVFGTALSALIALITALPLLSNATRALKVN